jgi:RNA-directed DNA polymerase
MLASGNCSEPTRSVRQMRRANAVGPIGNMLVAKLRGHYGYFGVTGNMRALERFRHEVVCAWCKWLSRRSNRARRGGWEAQWARYLERYPLPNLRIMRPFTASLVVT